LPGERPLIIGWIPAVITLEGPSRNNCVILGVEAPGWQGVRSEHGPCKPDDGSFEFVTSLSREARGSRFALESFTIHQDGSVGTTRWIFRLRANGQDLFTIPLHRYEDEGHPTRCVVRDEEQKAWRQALIPVSSGQFTLDIDALKP